MNQNETKPLTADQTLRKWCEYTYPSLSDAAKMALQTACHSYAAQQVEQVTEERDELARLISDNPLCDTVVDPMLQRAWEACATLCEKAEFKFLFKYAHNMEKRAKDTTEERDKAVDLLDESRVQLQYLDKRFPTGTTANVLGRIETFLNSLNDQ